MSKKTTPPEFPSDWHYEQHLRDLERELDGRVNRLAELQSLNAAADIIAQAEMETDAVRTQLKYYGQGHEQASKRPAQAREKR
jgi:hypothetical protein